MMKNDRQNMILEIISQENIETQEQLLSRLQERGITSTQATISRDIKQMHLGKEPVLARSAYRTGALGMACEKTVEDVFSGIHSASVRCRAHIRRSA